MHPMHRRAASIATRMAGVLLALSITGCAGAMDLGAPRPDGPDPVAFPECQAESYDFVGRSTLAALGLDVATPVPPPEPNRVAMIWVTHDLLPRDFGEPGGPVEMTRMLCFEFDDGTGGSAWPVSDAWQPPGAVPEAGQGGDSTLALPTTMLLIGIVAAVVLTVSAIAFWRPRSS